MHTNDANSKILYKELSYELTGLFFKIHNALGRFSREKQYADALEKLLQEKKIIYEHEKMLPITEFGAGGNKVDFIIEDEIIVDIKAKSIVTKEDYFQMQRYLHAAGKKLELIVNFRNRYLKPIRMYS